MSLTRWLVPMIVCSTLALAACAEPAVAPVSPVAPVVGVATPVASVSPSTCTPGYYDPNGGSNCIAASPGAFVAISGATIQVSCLPGTFSSQPASTRCQTTQPGFYTPFPKGGGTYEIPCYGGTYQPRSGQTECLSASPGYYAAGDTNTTQTACAAGTYQPSYTQQACRDASIGYFAVGIAATFQTPCAIGTFSPVPASTSCTPAPAGSYVAATAQGAATACVPGTYQPAEGQASCLVADVGYYVDMSNAIAQTVCPAGLTTFTTGATSLALCVRLFDWQGFDSRLDASALNAAKGGSVVLVRFSLGTDEGLGVFQPGFPTSAAIACSGGATTSAETETDSAGQSTLSYDATTGQYKYIWKTEKGWNGTCRRLTIKFSDTSVRTIDFQFAR